MPLTAIRGKTECPLRVSVSRRLGFDSHRLHHFYQALYDVGHGCNSPRVVDVAEHGLEGLRAARSDQLRHLPARRVCGSASRTGSSSPSSGSRRTTF
jgi:hypothetical protein